MKSPAEIARERRRVPLTDAGVAGSVWLLVRKPQPYDAAKADARDEAIAKWIEIISIVSAVGTGAAGPGGAARAVVADVEPCPTVAVLWAQPPVRDETVKLELRTKPRLTFIDNRTTILKPGPDV